jgi:hypothetical protein
MKPILTALPSLSCSANEITIHRVRE